jgi:hypothetical protein
MDVSPDAPIEGTSFASILRGEEIGSPRNWILSMGGHPASIGSDGRIKNYFSYRDRVIRDERYNVYIDTLKQIYRIYDLEKDPYETNNLIEDIVSVQPLIEKFGNVLRDLPQEDNHPRYERLDQGYYDIPQDKLNGMSRRIHKNYQNMIRLATSEEYDELKK